MSCLVSAVMGVLVVYVATPVAYAVAFWWQSRTPGGDQPRTPAPPHWVRWVRWVLTALAISLVALGVAVLLAPAAVAPACGRP